MFVVPDYRVTRYGRHYDFVPNIREGRSDGDHHGNDCSRYFATSAQGALSGLQENPQMDAGGRMGG